MKRPYTIATIALMLSASTGVAQTLNQGNAAPTAGDVLSVYQAPYIAPGSPGANQNWNFSALTTGTVITNTYATPASTGYASFFPNANLAVNDGMGTYGFYLINSSGMETVGAYSAPSSAALPYQNPQKLMTYPCSFNTTWTDPFSSNYTISGIDFVRTGTITGTADGYGTVVMPYGTVTNVLRVRLVETLTDVSSFSNITYSNTMHQFWKPGNTSGPIAAFNDISIDQGGGPQTNQFVLWQTTAPSGILERNADAIGIDLFPNPATDQLSIVFGCGGGSTQLELLDATGRLVRSELFAAMAMGINRVDLDVNDLQAGTYLVRIIAADGDQGTKRLIVQ